MVFTPPGHSEPEHYRGGIHSMLRGCQGSSLGAGILLGDSSPRPRTAAAMDGLGRSNELVQNEPIPETEPPHRTSVPLPPAASSSTEDADFMGTWE